VAVVIAYLYPKFAISVSIVLTARTSQLVGVGLMNVTKIMEVAHSVASTLRRHFIAIVTMATSW
jgi:hypothetical protein